MKKKSILLGLFISLLFVLSATNVSAQKKYSGSRHSSSHGGRYSGGRGSSHKGGSYKHSSTSNRYGRHKH
jgi:hypothetical protein